MTDVLSGNSRQRRTNLRQALSVLRYSAPIRIEAVKPVSIRDAEDMLKKCKALGISQKLFLKL